MSDFQKAAQQARNALANARDYIYLLETGDVSWSEESQLQEIQAAILALKKALMAPEQQLGQALKRAIERNNELEAELHEQARANGMGSEREARLMALNAELVEALQAVVEVWFRPNGINYVDFKPYMEAARAALAKASK